MENKGKINQNSASDSPKLDEMTKLEKQLEAFRKAKMAAAALENTAVKATEAKITEELNKATESKATGDLDKTIPIPRIPNVAEAPAKSEREKIEAEQRAKYEQEQRAKYEQEQRAKYEQEQKAKYEQEQRAKHEQAQRERDEIRASQVQDEQEKAIASDIKRIMAEEEHPKNPLIAINAD